MKNRLILLLTTASLGLVPLLGFAQEDEPPQMNNLAVTDLSVATAIVSWTTDQKTTGNKIEVTSADSTWEVADEYGSPTYAHVVTVVELEPAKTYTFKVMSADQSWDNGGEGYSFTTIGYSGAGNPRIISGKLTNSWGNPVERCLIRYSVTNSFEGESLQRLAVSDGEGNWNGNVGIMFNSTGDDILTPALDGEKVILEKVANYWSSDADTLNYNRSFGTQSMQVTDPNAPSGNPGDVDGNGKLNIFDLLDLLKVMGDKITPTPQQAAASDVDGNGKIDIFDLLALLGKLKTA